jgi:hypothetical protein
LAGSAGLAGYSSPWQQQWQLSFHLAVALPDLFLPVKSVGTLISNGRLEDNDDKCYFSCSAELEDLSVAVLQSWAVGRQ